MAKYAVSFPPELVGKRVVFMVDCIASGHQTRCMVKVGDIVVVDRLTSAGHCFSFFDEENAPILPSSTRCRVFMDGHSFGPQLASSNNVFVPFSTKSGGQRGQCLIVQRDDDPTFNVLRRFDHSAERYSFDGDLFVDREQLLDKERATLMVRAALHSVSGFHSVCCRAPRLRSP